MYLKWKLYKILFLLFSLQLMIGYAQYHCLCVQYALPDYTIMIIAIAIAIAVLILLIILGITLYVLHRRRQAKLAKKEILKNDSKTSLDEKVNKNEDQYVNSEELYQKNDSAYLQVNETEATSL